MPPYISPHGPRFKPQLNIAGYPLKSLRSVGISASAFGIVAGGTVIYLLEGLPRVQNDILKNIPLIGSYWIHPEKPASDIILMSGPVESESEFPQVDTPTRMSGN